MDTILWHYWTINKRGKIIMEYYNLNFGFNDVEGKNPLPLPTVHAGDVFRKCNLSRKMSGTFLFDDILLYFIDTNLSGTDIKPSWVIDDQCFIAQNDWDLTEESPRIPTITWSNP